MDFSKVPNEEKDTPPASPAGEKPESQSTEPASEGAKTPEESDKKTEKTDGQKADDGVDDFHNHSRFKELVTQKNDYKRKYEEMQSALDEMREEINGLKKGKGDPEDTPKFETIEDLQKYVTELPARIRAELLAEQEKSSKEEQEKSSSVQKVIDDQLEELRDTGAQFNEKELMGFAVKYGIPDLRNAYKLMQDMSKEAAEKKKQEIEDRKKNSGLQKPSFLADGQMPVYRRGQSLDDIFQAAKDGIPK